MDFDYLIKSLKLYEEQLRPNSRLQHTATTTQSSFAAKDCPVVYDRFNRTAATPGEHRGKYSRKLLFVTTELPSSKGFYSSVDSSPTRPSTAELARRSVVKCASLSDGFQRAINFKEDGSSPLHCRLHYERTKSRPNSSMAAIKRIPATLKNSPYLQKLQGKSSNQRTNIGRTL